MTLPDTACDKWPTNKYCEFTGNDPARFLQRTWIASGLNPGFSLKVHNDSECDSFLRDFSGRIADGTMLTSSGPAFRTASSRATSGGLPSSWLTGAYTLTPM